MATSLYDFPDIYGSLLRVEPDVLEDVCRCLRKHLGRAPIRVLDPACGPGNWLLPFAHEEHLVAGNDIRSEMIAEARNTLSSFPYELHVGDMADFSFKQRDFDVALNMDASIGHLATDEQVARHLQTVADHLVQGGLYLFGAVVFDRVEESQHEHLYEGTSHALERGGYGRLRYTSLQRSATKRFETVQMELWTTGVSSVPSYLCETYDLFTFPAAELAYLIYESPFELVEIYDVDGVSPPTQRIARDAGDISLLLRKR